MKKSSFLIMILIVLVNQSTQCQINDFALKAQKLLLNFNNYHYKPISINESTAVETVQLFVNELDDAGFIFIKSDVEMLKFNEEQFFSLIQANDNSFANNSLKIYLSALERMDSVFTSISNKKLNFSENDTLNISAYSVTVHYAQSVNSYAKYIEKYIKYTSMLKVQNTVGFDDLSEAEYNAKAQEISKSVIQRNKKRIELQKAYARETIESSLLNSIALRYDPHSNYFTEQQKRSFSLSLSKDVDSFGFFLDEDDDGNIIIAYIEPGGSAWLSNEVHEGDIFVSIKIDNQLITNEENSIDEIQSALDNSQDKKLILTLKKQNSQFISVKLIKKKATSTENTVKGYVLKGNNKNIGYISLPSFYTDMEDMDSPGCANDVAKEILKMEQDTIEGLILDLRNNGGGSMLEAMNLAGIFVDEGPLFIYKIRDQKPQLVKDINRGSIFKKPLVILINENSASASELLCNIIKDYNLGLVVGQSSYGKGTSQFIIPLDSSQLKQKFGHNEATDFLKITSAGFYRLNCKTHQADGVIPDVFLPAIPGYSFNKENKESFFIPADSIVKKLVYSPKTALDISSIQAKSKVRIQQSSDFIRFQQSADSLLNMLNNPTKVNLNYRDFNKYYSKRDGMFESFVNACKTKSKDVSCLNNTFDKSLTNMNEYTKEFNTRILESIQEDIFIHESYYIINDLISITK